MLELLQVLGVIVCPFCLRTLVPWVAPKFEPLTVTVCPTFTVLGERLLIEGVGGVPTKNW